MSNIKITNGIKGSFPAQTAMLAFDMLTVKTSTGSKRTYPVKNSIMSLDIISEHGKSVVFEMTLNDGAHFRGETNKKTVHHLTKFVGAAPVKTSKVTVEQTKRDTIIGGVAVGLIMVFALYKCSGDSTDSSPRALSENQKKSEAVVYCQNLVENSLKAPSTADFPWTMQATAYSGDVYGVNSYVDAQNGFGAMIRTHFTCQLQYVGQGSGWKVKALDIE